jgi:murein DD-endopeptidase MepM/ murein hydrolase activator NlpD
MKSVVFTLVFYAFSSTIFAQNDQPLGGGAYIPTPSGQCLSEEDRELLSQTLVAQREILISKGVLKASNKNTSVQFEWPLRPAPGLSGYYSYFATNNFVDQDESSVILDYNCDSRAYDGHAGSDFDTWPFPWYLYDNDLVEVIAAASGTIIYKIDGNKDDNCGCSGDWNAVFIEHSDGSIAFYGHLKKASLTTKIVGQTVSTGEYLGVVASSGCSTAPHLHWEIHRQLPYIRDNLIDPYAGACNNLNSESWWVAQPPNREPQVNALMLHSAPPQIGCPGDQEIP